MRAHLRQIWARLRAWQRADALDRDFDDEFESHVAMLAEAHVARGLSPEDARRAALQQIGARQVLAEAHRRVRGLPWADTVLGDVRNALRRIVRRPSETLPVVATLALGIGVVTALFSVLDSALWHRVPLRDADRLVEIWSRVYDPTFITSSATDAQVTAWRAQTDLFDWVEAYQPASLVYQTDEQARLVHGAVVTPALLARLGVLPHLGRLFAEGDGRAGSERKVVVSHAFWRRELLGDADVVGRTIALDDERYDVIGVMPASFRFPDARTRLWLPYDVAAPPPAPPSRARDAAIPIFRPIARLRGPSFDRADALVKARGDAVNASAATPQKMGAVLMRFGGEASTGTRRLLLLLGGAGLVLLLIVCVNVSALTLSHQIAEAPALAIRAALGASRWNLLREDLVVRSIVGLLGTGAGLGLARGILVAIDGFISSYGPINAIDLDGRALLFAAGVGLLSAVVSGLPAALGASTTAAIAVWRRESRTVSRGRWTRRLRTGLVGCQIALSVVLLMGAALLAQTVQRLYGADRGFDPDGLVTVAVGLPKPFYVDAGVRDRFVAGAAAALARVPGVAGAGVGRVPPSSMKVVMGRLEIDTGEMSDTPMFSVATLYEVSPTYFATVGIPLVEGTTFGDADPADAVVVSERFARAHWPDGRVVGRRFRVSDSPWRTIVGVAGDVRHVATDESRSQPQIYHRAGRVYEGGIGIGISTVSILADERHLVARLDRNAPASHARLTAAITAVDPRVVVDIEPAEAAIAEEIARSRLTLVLLSGFALFALLISAAGLYGLVACDVEQRRHEVGIRLALGERRASIGGRIVRRTLTLASVSIAIGLGAAFASSAALRSELYGVTPFDPSTAAAVCATLAGVAAAGAWVPARRAMRTDPVRLLRAE